MSAQPPEPAGAPHGAGYEKPAYRRLIRKHRPLIGLVGTHYHAWLADDHLLHVSEGPYTERYQRLYFRDIEALSLRQTPARRKTALWLTAIAGLWCVLMGLVWALLWMNDLTQTDPGFWMAWFAVFTALGVVPCVMLVLVNLAQGPTSELRAFTRVQSVELPAFRRLRRARPALALLREAVEESQGALPPARAAQAAGTATPASATARATGFRATHTAPRVEPGRYHLAAYGVLLLQGLLSVMVVTVTVNPWIAVGSAVLGLVVVICTLMALAGQRRSTVPGSLRSLTWGVLVYMAVSLTVTMVWGFVVAVGDLAMDPFAMMQATVDAPGARMLAAVTGAVELLLALPGLAMTLRYRSQLYRGGKAGVDGQDGGDGEDGEDGGTAGAEGAHRAESPGEGRAP